LNNFKKYLCRKICWFRKTYRYRKIYWCRKTYCRRKTGRCYPPLRWRFV